jgi:hypothetical protein
MPQVWTKNEEIDFLKKIKEGKSINELATQYNRSPSGLTLRLKKIIYENINNNVKESSLAKLLNMKESQITQYKNDYEKFIKYKENKGIHASQTKSTLVSNIKVPSINTPKFPLNNPVPHVGGNNDSLESNSNKFFEKLNKIKKENKIMKELVDNVEFRKKINKMIENGILDKKIKKIIKKTISSN